MTLTEGEEERFILVVQVGEEGVGLEFVVVDLQLGPGSVDLGVEGVNGGAETRSERALANAAGEAADLLYSRDSR